MKHILRVAVLAVASLFLTVGAFAADENVRCVQQFLLDNGYNPGPADGGFGPKTAAAAGEYLAGKDDSSLPKFSKATAKQWCTTLVPPLTLVDGHWSIGIGGGCGILTVSDDGEKMQYEYGKFCTPEKVGEVEFKTTKVRIQPSRTLQIEAAVCRNARLVETTAYAAQLRCDWDFNGYKSPVSFRLPLSK